MKWENVFLATTAVCLAITFGVLGVEAMKALANPPTPSVKSQTFAKLYEDATRRSIENCIKRGKTVVFSSWDHSIKDCR